MSELNQAHIARVVEFLRREARDDVSLNDVVALAGVMTESLESFFASLDAHVSEELGAISSEISAMKSEIAQLRPSDIREQKLPDAGRELDAVVEETEAATHRIMEAAEAIMSADIADNDAYRAFVSDQMVDIFEACTFQDITGQRISKVVRTLESIDTRVQRFVERTRMRDHAVQEEAVDDDQHLLNGPQLAGAGIEQGDVDALMQDAEFEALSSQDDIDALFG